MRETWAAKQARLGQWHRWFAWHPVVGDDFVAWLACVERRCRFVGVEGGWICDYRLIGKAGDRA